MFSPSPSCRSICSRATSRSGGARPSRHSSNWAQILGTAARAILNIVVSSPPSGPVANVEDEDGRPAVQATVPGRPLAALASFVGPRGGTSAGQGPTSPRTFARQVCVSALRALILPLASAAVALVFRSWSRF